MSGQPSRLVQLQFLRRYLLGELERVERWIATEEQREAAARPTPPPVPDWVLSYPRAGATSRPDAVHVGDCGMAGKRTKPITRDQALRALAEGVEACQFCRPDSELGWLD
ncbi:hypothetical protein DT019_02720 [Streptomyces sp. SDr-06]|uniref:DUF6233 domain-containing protein n=1 Tax=Streptomyces sp. SDr-06 TaxID=2267702 RepID=UPI000DE973FF|nr:DUF6233 domain-containing protein [Streptomyces sp. SDr-06]RCH70416.1 hypothetical protein DT019_02720 [Streptomyces sp. SDr-06]